MLTIIGISLLFGQVSIAPPDSFFYPLRTDTTQELEFTVFPPDAGTPPFSYRIDWGDGETIDWTEPVSSRTEITRYHRYLSTRKFAIRVMVRDSRGNISEWSRPCSVEVTPALIRWFAPTLGAVFAAPALDALGNVYIGDDTGNFYAFTPDGTLRWTFQTRGAIHSGATVHRDRIYLPCLDSTLYCLDTTGKLHWSLNLKDELWTPVTVGRDGALYIVSDAGNLTSITPQGKIRWTVRLGENATSAPTLGRDGMLYVATDSVYCFTPKGRRRWAFGVGEDNYFFPAPVPDPEGNLLLGCSDGSIYCLRPDGKLRWRLPVPDEDEIRTEIVSGPDGTIFWGTDGYYLCAKSETGRTRIVYEANDVVCSTPAVDRSGAVYILPDDGTFYCFNAAGHLLFKVDIAYGEKEIYYTSSPAIGPDGTVYIGSWDGGVYAFYGNAPPAGSIWPQFRQNSAHTGAAPPGMRKSREE